MRREKRRLKREICNLSPTVLFGVFEDSFKLLIYLVAGAGFEPATFGL
jgi:hypothetical protein